MMTIELVPLGLSRDIVASDDLAALVLDTAPPLRDGDIVVVTHKAVSKAEGRVVDLGTVQPSARAFEVAADHSDPRLVEVILRESRRILRQRGPLLVVETHHGLVCANAGVDRSNAPRPDAVVLLPVDPDLSATRLRTALEARTKVRLGVIIADTMGRAWREGIIGTAIGASGVETLRELTGAVDPNGYELHSSVVAIADELAAAADLAFGKLDRVPFVLIRGYPAEGDGAAREVIRPRERDLFR
jgi:coenzyme F420-0:L-glutamate ligase / coenzyme F420-1:gamma-L-glutamate ligase